MKILRDESDCGYFAVSGLFATEHLKMLKGDSVKLYIYLNYLLSAGKEISESGILVGLGFNVDMLRNAVEELKLEGLIAVEDGNVVIFDPAELKFRKKMGLGAIPSFECDLTAEDKEFGEAVGIIQSKYFAGKMTRQWYELLQKYRTRLTPEVLLMLFEHCEKYCDKTRKGLTKAYVEAVADSWVAENIKDAKELDEYLRVRSELSKFINFIGKKMNRSAPFMDSEVAVMRKWLFEYHYGEAELSLVLDWTRFNNPTIGAFDRLLTAWYGSGLKNAAEIKEYLEKNKKINAEKPKKGNSAGTHMNGGSEKESAKGNFEQRQYSEDFYEALISGGKSNKNDTGAF